MKILEKTIGECGKIKSMLNQISRHFNTGGERSLAMEEEIHHCIFELFEPRKEVLKLEGEVDGDTG